MPLPETKWTPVYLPNPNRRWWQFWKPRWVFNPEALPPLFGPNDILVDGIIWKEVPDEQK
jgi:hypothetical protein